MLATDVAARGLDINDVEWVVNFDFPLDIENYIHRIGRTGRASKKGQSLTYMTVDEARFAKKLKKILIESDQEVPEDLIELEKEEKRSKVVKGKLGKELEKGNFRARNYGYRGMGRDDGNSHDEYDFKQRNRNNQNFSRRNNSNQGLHKNYNTQMENYDRYGFPVKSV